MRKIQVHDKAIVLVLKKGEAEALAHWLELPTGCRKPKAVINAETKLAVAMGLK